MYTHRARENSARAVNLFIGGWLSGASGRALYFRSFLSRSRGKSIKGLARPPGRPAVVINGRFCLARAREIPMGRSCAAEPAFSASGIWFIPGRYGRDSPLSLSTDRNMERHTREAIIGRISRAFHPSSFSIAKARFGILEGLPEV